MVGPILNRLAENAGVVFTPADGDQPSLLIRLISWAETLGLEIVCGGKAGELDFVYDLDSNSITRGNRTAPFAGGVFAIIKCRERETWQLLKNKGHLVNRSGTHAMIFRPYHLLGVETATSVLTASRMKLSTGGIDIKPRVDVGVRASRTLQQGYRLALNESLGTSIN